VDSKLQPFLFQKARRTLPVTVKSDSGLAEGEIWFIEGDEITFWCVERLEVAARYEMRADIKTLGRNVDLLVEVVDAMAGRDAGVSEGYLHCGEFNTLEVGDERRLRVRFWQLNPEHAPPGFESEIPPGVAIPSPPMPRDSVRGKVPEGSAPSRDARRRDPPSVRSKGSSERRQPPPTPGERRRLRQRERQAQGEIPQPPLAREVRAVADVAPGNPSSVMVRYEYREVMQADVLLRDDRAWFFIGCHPLLAEGEEVSLFVQLPAGHVVQMRGSVVAERRDHCVILCKRLHASLLANVRAALGG
jgi:hypothetical protein